MTTFEFIVIVVLFLLVLRSLRRVVLQNAETTKVLNAIGLAIAAAVYRHVPGEHVEHRHHRP